MVRNPKDTNEITFYCDPPTEKSDNKKHKILKNFASKLNGYWKSDLNSDVLKFIVSKKNFSGQMIFPFEAIQQAPPIAIKLIATTFGKVKLIKSYSPNQADTLDINITENKLVLEKSTYHRKKK